MAPKQPTKPPLPPRERMIRAAADLLVEGGRAAASTRAVSAAAGVQAPAIYRQFGDLDGLLRMAAREVMRDYVRAKALRTPLADPLEDLRRGFDQHVAFGLAHPGVFAILSTAIDDDDDDDDPAHTGQAILHGLVERIARAGLLRVSVDHAVALIHAAGAGATLALIGTPEADRDLRVATDLREATLAAITIVTTTTTTAPTTSTAVAARAIALQAVLADSATTALSPGERRLLDEWLARLSSS